MCVSVCASVYVYIYVCRANSVCACDALKMISSSACITYPTHIRTASSSHSAVLYGRSGTIVDSTLRDRGLSSETVIASV